MCYNVNMVNLITTNSYFNMFDLLIKDLQEKGGDIQKPNLVFCEEKVSLMIERMLCYKLGGSFDTEVYSFGNFLRVLKPMNNLLSKEGSTMVVKRILSSLSLNCFKASSKALAPTLYDLIIQLKSAKITPNDILFAKESVGGILRNKLEDIYTVYNGYEQFIKDNNFEDQSSYLSYLPSVIEKADILNGANVYVVGFSGFTAQLRSAINSLIERTNNLTAILCEGDNELAFVNETSEFIKNLCKKQGYPLIYKNVPSDYTLSGKMIVDNLFNPFVKGENKGKNDIQNIDNVYYSPAINPFHEVERVAQIIKQKVLSGDCRYKDISLAIPDSTYNTHIENLFKTLEIPYFIDERKKPEHHPLIKLVLAYVDVFRKNFERKTLLAFIKNPFFCEDKFLLDKMENYLIKYNVNYSKIKSPFTFNDGEYDLEQLNELRQKIVDIFNEFNVIKMFEELNVKEKAEQFTERLFNVNQVEESAINAQIYDAVTNILSQIKLLLGQVKLTLNEYKNVFTSGISALEMSIIPQYNDAVFIGAYKQIALAKTKHLFAIGLTNAVPNVQADVSLLSDNDISVLEDIKLLVEPKIRVVNHRIRENVVLSLGAFTDSLYLSYPVCTENGSKNIKGEIICTIEKMMKLKPFPKENGYLTKKQGLKTFAKECGEFADGKIQDFVNASSYYMAVDGEKAKDLLNRADVELKETLSSSREILISKVVSPTTIEDYYKCPYRSFMAHGLRLKKREEGNVDVLSVGNLMHDIFSEYALKLEQVQDENSSNALFDDIAKEILEREQYKKFLEDTASKMTVKRVLLECKKYCYKTFLYFNKSDFKVKKTEVKFGDNEYYPAIDLLNGEVKIKGKIDRVDENQKYFRVIDYKTGSTDSTDKSLFAGTKLQLLLYGSAVKNKYKNGEKLPAGLYYLPIADKYEKPEEKGGYMADGRTLNQKDAIESQDKTFFDNGGSEFMPIKMDKQGNLKNTLESNALSSYLDYAIMVSELAVSQLKDGVIVPSPYGKTCDYCDYKGICKHSKENVRTLGKVNEDTIVKAKGGEQDAQND